MHYFKLDFKGSQRFKFSRHKQPWIYLLGPWRGINSEWLEEGLSNGRGKPTASVLSTDGFPLMAGPNFQPSDGNPTIISILRQLANGLENVPEM